MYNTYLIFLINFLILYMDVVTGGRDFPINSNKHTLQQKPSLFLLLSGFICVQSNLSK
jgi:hypothetical protein